MIHSIRQCTAQNIDVQCIQCIHRYMCKYSILGMIVSVKTFIETKLSHDLEKQKIRKEFTVLLFPF